MEMETLSLCYFYDIWFLNFFYFYLLRIRMVINIFGWTQMSIDGGAILKKNLDIIDEINTISFNIL